MTANIIEVNVAPTTRAIPTRFHFISVDPFISANA
jgi:hypothetical protein